MRLYDMENEMRDASSESINTKMSQKTHECAERVLAQDYFGTTATVVDLCAQLLEKEKIEPHHIRNIHSQLSNVRDEMLYIHGSCKLVCK